MSDNELSKTLRRDFLCGGKGYHNLQVAQDNSHVFAIMAGAIDILDVRPEPIYAQDRVIASELLSSPKPKSPIFQSNLDNIGAITEGFYKDGYGIEVDTFLCTNALNNAPKDRPFTLNISTQSAQSPEFFESLEESLSLFKPRNVIWEVLEHRINRSADLNHITDLREKGNRIWLDDLEPTPPNTGRLFAPEHQSRIDMFIRSGLADTIKFNGEIVRAHFECDKMDTQYTRDCLPRAVEHLTNEFPYIKLVAEHVQNRAETDTLFNMGFDGVQGYNLKLQDFHYTDEASTEMTLDDNSPSNT